MTCRTQRHDRRSIRLKGYDYARPGAYFVTICTHDRASLFGQIVEAEMRLNAAGQVLAAAWNVLPDRFPNVRLDAFVVMPNHVHGIIVLTDAGVGAGSPRPYKTVAPLWERPALGRTVAFFKYQSTKRINELRATPGMAVWQRNYYEHVVRSDESLNRIREYILTNPLRWDIDRENPVAVTPETESTWRA